MVSRSLVLLLFTVFGLSVGAFEATVQAHHSYVTKYNPKKPITISGVIVSVSYINPHIMFSVQTSAGTWRVETESILKARAKGLTKSLLATGKKVRVTGWRARNGSASLGMRVISFAGGKTITMRNSPR